MELQHSRITKISSSQEVGNSADGMLDLLNKPTFQIVQPKYSIFTKVLRIAIVILTVITAYLCVYFAMGVSTAMEHEDMMVKTVAYSNAVYNETLNNENPGLYLQVNLTYYYNSESREANLKIGPFTNLKQYDYVEKHYLPLNTNYTIYYDPSSDVVSLSPDIDIFNVLFLVLSIGILLFLVGYLFQVLVMPTLKGKKGMVLDAIDEEEEGITPFDKLEEMVKLRT
ncbi:hypothetical protein PCE1_001953 [Barthelona sp. PCE]